MSPPLLYLPSELLSKIFTLLLPNGLLDLSLCCKSLSELAKPSLKRHKELSQRYKTLYLGYSVEIDGLLSPIAFLDMIMNDPNMVYYPRVLQLLEYSYDQLDDDGDEADGNWFEGRVKEEKIVEKWGGFREIVENCPYLALDEHSSWTTALLEKGDDDVALAILLSLLPNLKEVVIWLHYRPLPCTSQTVSRIAQAARQKPEDAHSLSKLQSFRLGQRGDTDADNLSFVLPFMDVPSVWHIAGWHVKQESGLNLPPLEERPENEWPPSQSATNPNIKMLAFEQSSIDGYAMTELISRTSDLRSFVYEVDGNMPYDVVFVPDTIVDALETYAAQSLEELQIVVQPEWAVMEPWRHIVSLRAFEILRVVEIEAEFLCRADGEDVSEDLRPLVESMPEALECVALRHLRFDQTQILFEGFGDRRRVELMLLKKVVLIHPDRGNDAESVVEIVREACQAGGVKLEVWDRKDGSPFHEPVMEGGMVERPTLCGLYPRNWD